MDDRSTRSYGPTTALGTAQEAFYAETLEDALIRIKLPLLLPREALDKDLICKLVTQLDAIERIIYGEWSLLIESIEQSAPYGIIDIAHFNTELIHLLSDIPSAYALIGVASLRIEQIGEHESASMAAGAAIAVVGWWTGFKLGGMIALVVAEYFQTTMGIANYWQYTFIFLSGLIVLCNIGLLFIPEVSSIARQQAQLADQQKLGSAVALPGVVSWFASTILSPMTSFFRKNGVSIGIAILSFIFLFKIGEAFMGKMSIVFYKELGFSKSDIAIYSKTLGWITTVIFTLIGGWFAMRAGSLKALFLAGIAMAVTNVMFSVMAWSDKSELLFAVSVILDDVAAAFATVAFVAFISRLVDRTYTATQYALLASIGTLGRTLLASSSGAIVDGLDGDWGLFFIITALMVIPSLILLWFLRNKIVFENKPPISN